MLATTKMSLPVGDELLNKRSDFRKLLITSGAADLLTKALVQLYEEDR